MRDGELQRSHWQSLSGISRLLPLEGTVVFMRQSLASPLAFQLSLREPERSAFSALRDRRFHVGMFWWKRVINRAED
jgi:hypothetical protein